MSSYLLLNETYANRIRSVLTDIAKQNYYLFTAKNVSSREIDDADTTKYIRLAQNLGVGKRVTQAMPVIRNIPYTLNTVYDMYDDTRDETTVNNYVITQEGSNYYCYRCLDDNNDSESTEQPLYATILGNGNTVFRTSDGYAWKFLFSATQADVDTFGSAKFFPLTSYQKQANVVTGKLDIVAVETAGLGYGNYVTGQFSAADLRINGNRSMFAIANSTAKNVNGYYTGCALYISSGDGVGEWRIVTDYISNSNGNFVFLDSNLDTVQNGSQYEIYPNVKVLNNGADTNVRARAVINPSGNLVQRVEVLLSDSNLFNMTASVVANDAVGVLVQSTVRPINSPYGGHGYDLMNQLRAHHLAISVTLANTEANTIPANNDYQMIGLMRNPLFANVAVNVSNQIGSFAASERVYKITKTKIGVGAINTTSNTLVFSNFSSTANLLGQTLLITASNNLACSQVVTLTNVVNATAITLSVNGSFACALSDVYLVNVAANAIFSTYNGGTQMILQSLDNPLTTADVLIGATTGAFATVNNTIIGDITKDFSTFIGLQKYRVSSVSGDFIADEILTGPGGNTYFDSFLDDGSHKYVYCFDNSHIFSVGETITGGQSLATAVIEKVYGPEIIPGSADILYLENIDNIARANTTEEFKLYF